MVERTSGCIGDARWFMKLYENKRDATLSIECYMGFFVLDDNDDATIFFLLLASNAIAILFITCICKASEGTIIGLDCGNGRLAS